MPGLPFSASSSTHHNIHPYGVLSCSLEMIENPCISAYTLHLEAPFFIIFFLPWLFFLSSFLSLPLEDSTQNRRRTHPSTNGVRKYFKEKKFTADLETIVSWTFEASGSGCIKRRVNPSCPSLEGIDKTFSPTSFTVFDVLGCGLLDFSLFLFSYLAGLPDILLGSWLDLAYMNLGP